MAYPEVLIPPSVQPESPVDIELIDDQTVPFTPQFARGLSQRQTWGDPLWGMRLRYKGLSQADRAILKSVIAASRGKGANIRVTPGLPVRGSFPATQLLTNNDFSNGTTGWTPGSGVLSVSDRVARFTASQGGTAPAFLQSLTLTQYVPYVIRAMIADGADTIGVSGGPFLGAGNNQTNAYAIRKGLMSVAAVNDSAALQGQYPFSFAVSNGYMAGAFVECPWSSLSRCALVDNGPNALLYSDQIDNAAWTKVGGAITANGDTAADGTNTSDVFVENSSGGRHGVSQTIVRASAAEDWCAYGVFQYSVTPERDIQLILSSDTTPTNYAACSFTLAGAGTAGAASVGGTATNARAFIQSMGNGRYACFLIARLPATTTVYQEANLLSSGTGSYTGNGTSATGMWRVGAARSSVPVRLTQTTTTATTGTTQTSNRLYVKGLPASTNGLLLAGDFVEINGELERVIAPLDSNAAGLGVLILGRRRAVAPADNDPVIVLNPMGRFMIQAVRETERYGLYTDIELDLIEAPA